MKARLILLIMGLLATTGSLYAQGRENWFPNRGNVGIGTRTPVEALEVLGNVKVSQTVFANDLQTIGLSATNLTVSQDASIGRNLTVAGKVGIGVTAPIEKLEISGNVKATQRFIGDGLTVGDGAFSRGISVNQNIISNGNLGMGVAAPVERVDVVGNIKTTQRFLGDGLTVGDGAFSRGISVNQNIISNGNLGMGVAAPVERVEVAGNLKVTQRFLSDGITTGDGIFARGLQVEQNVVTYGNMGIGVPVPVERLEVAGNIKAVNGLFSGTLNANQNLLVTGNVGVGNSSPTEKLDVTGNIKSSADVLAVNVRANKGYFSSLESDGNLTINGNVGIGAPAGSDKLTVGGSAKVNGLLTADNITVNQTLAISGVLSLGGSLGIGVASPEVALHVSGDGKFEGDIRANKIIVNSIEIAGAAPTGGGSVSLGENLIVNGSIGIGTTKVNGYKLSVNGKIRASNDIRVYVESQWSDFVFEDDYKLKPLSEIDRYIKKNNHLPEIPSAKEVKRDGYDVGAMDAKLLQKIEELTLYIIEQQRQIDRLSKKVNNKN